MDAHFVGTLDGIFKVARSNGDWRVASKDLPGSPPLEPLFNGSRSKLRGILTFNSVEQSTGSWGKTFLSLIIIISVLFPGLSLAASQNAPIDGARKEGKFVLYTAMQPEDSTKLIELYRSRFPFVDASFFRAGSAPLLNRILTESRAGRFLFDVVSGKVSDLLLLQKRSLLGTMVSSELAAYPDKFRDKQNRWVDIYNNYYTIAYNSQRVRPSEVPTAWDGLLDPRWRDGKITLDPRSYDWYFGMLTAWGGQRGGDFMRKLNQQNPAFRDGNVLIANLLAAGEFPIGITYAHLIERLRTRGAPVDWVALKPMVATPISIALAARPMNPNAANLFVDLVLSKEGSEILKSMGRVPTRSDVMPSAKRLDAKDLDLFSLHVSSDEMDPEDFRKSFGLR
jgi:iron(III) transport system substrate-binding protein